jgi:adenine deaminase
MQVSGNLLNLFDRTIRFSQLTIEQGRIHQIDELGPERPEEPYVLPGFVDAHVHIESSLLTPAQFARLAVVHGTVATVSDPHEIGNVLGIDGVEYMIADGKRVRRSSSVSARPPACPPRRFETAGATIGVWDIRRLLGMKEIGYLAEMMNFPGVSASGPGRDGQNCAGQRLQQTHRRPRPRFAGRRRPTLHRRRHDDRPRVFHVRRRTG